MFFFIAICLAITGTIGFFGKGMETESALLIFILSVLCFIAEKLNDISGQIVDIELANKSKEEAAMNFWKTIAEIGKRQQMLEEKKGEEHETNTSL